MTNTERLKWLALNVSEFPRYAIYATTDGVVASYAFSLSNKPSDWFTMEEWKQERDRVQNKPGWRDAPAWAEFLAQSPTGSWEWYSGKPIAGASFWMHVDAGIHGETENHGGKVIGDWRRTLEARPEVIVSNQTSAAITPARTGDSKMTVTAQDNSWHERGDFPPVGAICEMIDDKNTWLECEIVSHNDGACIGWISSREAPFYTYDKSEFRSLRTEREKAIDEMIEIICSNGYLSKDGTEARDIAERIYDSGHHKGCQ